MPYPPPFFKSTVLQAGFTLIELMVVVVVTAILVAAAMPSFSALVNDSRVSGYTNEFIGSMTLARTEAVTRSRLVTICRSANANDAKPTCSAGADWNSGWLVFTKASSAGNLATVENGDTILQRQGAMVKNVLALSDPAISSITFNAMGEPTAGGLDARFNFSYNKLRPREVCINRNGRVKVVHGGVDGSVC